MKIFFNEKLRKGPWGGGVSFLSNFVQELKEKGHDIVFSLKKKIDLIFILSNSKPLDEKIFEYKKKYPETKVIHRINECDKRKNTNNVDVLIFKSNQIADQTVFISKWLAQYFIDKGFTKSYHVIYNGCNENYFFPIDNKKIDGRIKLITHHWSDNWMKGFDIYNQLDKLLEERNDIEFTYIGRYNPDYKPRNINMIPPLYGIELGNELRKHDIYLTASRWEPCGMHHIEGARCGLPVLYHRDGGGINESCKYYGIEYQDMTSLVNGIEIIKKSYNDYRNKIRYDFLSSKRNCDEFYNIILKMFE
ncbi:MAG: hypothetical protein ACFFBP_17600 [Promethearchaeota archaeon]